MAQTSYSINLPPVAYPGQPFDIASVMDMTSALAVAAPIPYGVLAVRDLSNIGQSGVEIACKVPALSTDITALGSALGVVVADQARAQDPSSAIPQYPQYGRVPCGRVGRFWVLVEEAVVAGQQAFVRYATGSFSQKGAFRASADTGSAAALPGAYYVTSQVTPGSYAVVEMSLV